ncbi:MAG: hypothetical protein KUF77_09680 [Candidatus Thiodiazotropha sp. (ex Lucina aurantia)]|nr:hypothetical protein [Candidatus Thiodiazotropha taylori]MBV2097848.1 hypothetical protein [Candidatus Thiodiazotropha sp. (ex Codakia orbicularis)]MBV2103279.1 hypothetical protein [Candidatus Thiodiazotropha sp. (ex Lucina aurantia)]MBV2116358.1 hypothetical protein [Candidatus Thiodiazotropha sp. (ex Lucina aurantia)]
MKQNFVFILFMAVCIYICAAIVFWPDLMETKSQHSTWVLVLYNACPWLLLWLSIKGWYQSFVWRRMTQSRTLSPTLSRGAHRFDTQQKRTGLLEWLCLIFLTLALFALKEIWL